MRLIPVQYLRVGDVVDLPGYPAYGLVEKVRTHLCDNGHCWTVIYDLAGQHYYLKDDLLPVVGHDLELWEEPAELISQEWSLEDKAYVAEHPYTGQAD